MTPTQSILSVFAISISTIMACWSIMAYFNRQNRERWEATERHIMLALEALRGDIKTLREESHENRERVHQVEMSFKDLLVSIADKYAGIQSLNRLREEVARDIAQIRLTCQRRHGEGSGGGAMA